MVEKVLEDHRTAPLSEAEKALLAFIERVNADASSIRREDIESLKRAGWSEEAIYDAITVCGLFNFMNRWCDAAGVSDLTPEAYRSGARSMAERGYTHKL